MFKNITIEQKVSQESDFNGVEFFAIVTRNGRSRRYRLSFQRGQRWFNIQRGVHYASL